MNPLSSVEMVELTSSESEEETILSEIEEDTNLSISIDIPAATIQSKGKEVVVEEEWDKIVEHARNTPSTSKSPPLNRPCLDLLDGIFFYID